MKDYTSLRNKDGISYEEQTDEVPEDVVDQVEDLADLAGVGITNPGGEVLFRRLTDTCSWKIPVETVADEADFKSSIISHTEETLGVPIEVGEIKGVFDIQLRTKGGEKNASRGFVIFSGSITTENYDLNDIASGSNTVEEAGWFNEIPSDADHVPGTELFLDK